MPYTRIVNHAELITSTPYHVLSGHSFHITKVVDRLFRAERAERVEGINYEAFDVVQVTIGVMNEFVSKRPAVDLFQTLRRAEDQASHPKPSAAGVFHSWTPGEQITFLVVNNSDKPQPFAIWLTGNALL